MSTPCELIIYSPEKMKADKVAEAILVETKRLEKKYNYYDSESFLSALNNRSIQAIDNETKTLLQRAMQYYHVTKGVFDITVATFKNLYSNETDLKILEAQKQRLLPFVGCEHISLKKDKLVFDNEHTKIDLGGFVKEYAVDRAVGILKKQKIASALVNFGGDIYALGLKPDKTKFTVGIKDPQNLNIFAQHIEIQDQALTTSASYERNTKIDNETFSHILSKETKTSLNNSVTVISHNCVESGVYSTSLMININIKTNNKVIFL
ncbi:MAG TPA: FAD:protein FMN transferase [Sulfurimonas sp.]|nr:FAD:protein FMN transferase [Sulfurimonas sp.]